jgi:hypothetical protein
MLGEVKPGYDGFCHVRTGYVMLGQVRSCKARLCQVRSG